MKKIYISKFFSFIAGVGNNADNFFSQIPYLREFWQKIRNGPNGILRDPGDTGSWKKLEAEISCQAHFKIFCCWDVLCLSCYMTGLVYIFGNS